MTYEIVCFSTKSSIRKKLDRVRGDISRSKFITRAIEAFLRNQDPTSKGTVTNHSKDSLAACRKPSRWCCCYTLIPTPLRNKGR
jgi:metal-responsive CopG/Arc/MetJ family transcriptional regulator